MFNWFNRKFSDRSESPPSSPETQEPESAPSSEVTPAPESPSPEDYLQWAKAAYQNIQQRQLEEKSETEEVEQAEVVEEESELEPAPVVASEPERDLEPAPTLELGAGEPELELAPVVSSEPEGELELAPVVSSEPEGELELAPVVSSEPEGDLEPAPVVSSEPEGDLEPAPVVALEPEGDLESVEIIEGAPVAKEVETPEAIATVKEPETLPAWMQKSDALERLKATAIEVEPETPPQVTPPPALDEEFIWSAKVLAAQGRSPETVAAEEFDWLKRLRQGLGKTRRNIINQLKAIVGQGPLNPEAVLEIEALLLQADVGVEATDHIIETLQARLRQEALPPEQAIAYLKELLRELLDRPLAKVGNLPLVPEGEILNIWLIAGVNGAGKTTTIGKLAHLAQKSGYSCLIAAADTFRAAAVEQVKIWGERSETPVIANQGKNTDPAAVVFDAIAAARSRHSQLLLVDTAGRLQNKKNLMEELAKIRRIIEKQATGAKVESLLVLDATLGQNGLRQAQVFSEAAQLTGAIITKLDGTAKGGVALAVAHQLNLPIRFIGAGEGIEDLRPFSSYEFVEALLGD